MTTPKTLKTIGNQETLFYHSRNKEIIFMGNPDEKNIEKYDGKRFVLLEDLRSEVIKWIKEIEKNPRLLRFGENLEMPKEQQIQAEIVNDFGTGTEFVVGEKAKQIYELHLLSSTINFVINFFDLSEEDLK